MRIQIYQGYYRGYFDAEQLLPSLYRKVWEGDVPDDWDLDRIFYEFQRTDGLFATGTFLDKLEMPMNGRRLPLRSLSSGDIVVYQGRAYWCKPRGWEDVTDRFLPRVSAMV